MRTHIRRRGLLVLAAALIALAVAPARGAAADPVKAGDFSVEGGAQGTDWSFDADEHVLSILTGTEVTISMADGVEQTANNRIVIADGIDASVTLDGVNADFTDMSVSRSAYTILMIGTPGSDKGGSLRLTLAAGSVNKLRTTQADALAVENKGTLTIGGAGELDVESTDYNSSYLTQNGAAISASYGGYIVIEGGTINARAQGQYAAIGSSVGGCFGGIRISGGDVTATSQSDYNLGNMDYSVSAIGNGGYNAFGQFGDIVIEGGTVSAMSVGVHAGAAIGFYSTYYGGNFSPGNVSITGGYITALSDGAYATPIRDTGGKLSVTGGFFGVGVPSGTPGDDGDRGTVYNTAPDPGYTAIANEEPDSRRAYPVRVLKDDPYTLTAAQDGAALYDAERLDPEAIVLGGDADVTLDPAELSDHATFRYRAQGSDGPWADGLPRDAGAYEVEVSERPFADDTGELVLISRGPVRLRVVIDRRPLEVASASASPKAYDGGTDAAVSGVEFSGLVGGEHLWSGEDYTTTGAFADPEPGQGKPVVVTVGLKQDGPRSRNYVLSEGHDSAKITADIIAEGKDGKAGENGKDGAAGRDGRDGKDGVNGKDGKSGCDGRGGRDGALSHGAACRRATGRSGSKIPSTGDAAWFAGGASAVLFVTGVGLVALSRRKAHRAG